MSQGLISFSRSRPVAVYWLLLIATLVTGALISQIKIATDSENMLSADEPARAITRYALVIAFGFTPLLSPLVPYTTVGAFLAIIMGERLETTTHY